MAKQLGVSDQALQGLNDIDTFPFPPEEKAALRFAEAMTRGGGSVDDALFEELRRHFSEPQIVEIAGVIGTFNYFNRFNNALAVDITLADPGLLSARVAETLAAGISDPVGACDQALEMLRQGRRYGSIAIYVRKGDRLMAFARRGPEDAGGQAPVAGPNEEITMTDRELRVPIRSEAGLIGVVEVRSDRPGSLDQEDRTLIEDVASRLAPILASHPSGG